MKKQELLQKALKNIEENQKIVFLTDVYQSLGISASTFYRQFPVDSNEYNDINDALEANKTLMKREIRDRLANCKSPVGLIALYRLLTTDPAERALLDNRDYKQDNNNQEITLKIQ